MSEGGPVTVDGVVMAEPSRSEEVNSGYKACNCSTPAQCCSNTSQMIMCVLNFLVLLIGLGMLGGSGYVLSTLSEWSAYISQTGAIACLIFSFVICMIAFLGCCGACHKNKCLLFLYIFIMTFVVFIVLGFSIGWTVYGNEVCGGKLNDDVTCNEYTPARELSNMLVKIQQDCCGITEDYDQKMAHTWHAGYADESKLPECAKADTPAQLYTCVYPFCNGDNAVEGCVKFFSEDNTNLNKLDANVASEPTPVALCLAIKTLVFKKEVDADTAKQEWGYANDIICTENSRNEFIKTSATFVQDGMVAAGIGLIILSSFLIVVFIMAVGLCCSKKKDFEPKVVA